MGASESACVCKSQRKREREKVIGVTSLERPGENMH